MHTRGRTMTTRRRKRWLVVADAGSRKSSDSSCRLACRDPRGSFLFPDLLSPECTHFDLSVEPLPVPPSLLLAGLSPLAIPREDGIEIFIYYANTVLLDRGPFFPLFLVIRLSLSLSCSLSSPPLSLSISPFLPIYIFLLFRCKSRRA